jgi:hypothetical protein
MRYPADRKQQTSQRILNAASTLFRSRGYDATGIDAVMASADLTAGAFYALVAPAGESPRAGLGPQIRVRLSQQSPS